MFVQDGQPRDEDIQTRGLDSVRAAGVTRGFRVGGQLGDGSLVTVADPKPQFPHLSLRDRTAFWGQGHPLAVEEVGDAESGLGRPLWLPLGGR
jgi:hypothetical protein